MLKNTKKLYSDLEAVAREIYYAMQDIGPQANLQQALRILGVNEPKDVWLSNRILELINKKERS